MSAYGETREAVVGNVGSDSDAPAASFPSATAATTADEAQQEAGEEHDFEANPLTLDERLYMPHRKRLLRSYQTNQDGVRELRLDYGLKEVTFDEQHLFPWGEQLGRDSSFTGADAITWGPSYSWDEIRPLLEVLINEGIIKRGGGGEDSLNDPRGGGLVPSRLPPSTCPAPRMWSLAECEALSQDLGGRSFEIGHLESIVPVWRVAHPAMDADQRQVGEANVYPRPLRMDIETEWRVCQYSGSRYRDEMPMNVTGLKAMIKHWKPMMKTIILIRSAVRERFGAADHWTIGELHVMSSVVLAFTGYGLMKHGGTTPQVPLHPVLSSLFRITDGVRMVTSQLLFSIKHNRPASEPLSAAQLHDWAESFGLLVSDTGVCAGPKPLIDEFLSTAVDGVPADGIEELALPAEVAALVAELPEALEYGFLGMMAWGTSLSLWLEMSKTYRAIFPTLEEALAKGGAPRALLDHLRKDWAVLERQQIALDYDIDVHDKMYLDAYERSRAGLRTPRFSVRLADAIAARPDGPAHREAAQQLEQIFAARHRSGELAGVDAAGQKLLAEELVTLLRHEQAILAVTEQIQQQINELLARPGPSRPLEARDLSSFYAMNSRRGTFPYLFDTLDQELGIFVAATSSAIVISDKRAA